MPQVITLLYSIEFIFFQVNLRCFLNVKLWMWILAAVPSTYVSVQNSFLLPMANTSTETVLMLLTFLLVKLTMT